MVISATNLHSYINQGTVLPLRENGVLLRRIGFAEISVYAQRGQICGRGSKGTVRFIEAIEPLTPLERAVQERALTSPVAQDSRLTKRDFPTTWSHRAGICRTFANTTRASLTGKRAKT